MVYIANDQGFHVEISARTESDIDSKTIMKKVRDSSGAKYTRSVDVLTYFS